METQALKIRFAHIPEGFGFHVLGSSGYDYMGFKFWVPATIPIKGILSHIERVGAQYPSYQGVQETRSSNRLHSIWVRVDDYIEAMEMANRLLEELQSLGWHGGNPSLED